MFVFCPDCSAQRADVAIDHGAGTVTCPACGATRPYRSEPLLVVTGASCVGKTTTYREIQGTVDAVVFESDLFWLEPRGDVSTTWRAVADPARYAFVFLLCADVAQSGRPVVLFGSGVGDPERSPDGPERDYFARIEHLALTCDPDVLAERIRSRPGFDDAETPWADVDRQLAANERFREAARSRDDYDAVDTTDATPAETVTAVRDWLTARL